MSIYRIPFNRPYRTGRESENIQDALSSFRWSGDGPYTKRCHELLEKILVTNKVLLTTSCTHALEMAAILLDVIPGDEVIVPSYTFVSTVNAFILRGARPVFIDVRPDTLNMDERLLEQLITPRTKAIIPVHYAGVACEMDEIVRIAEAHGVAVVEDNAHGLFGKYRGRWLGSIGAMATLSFHETKNFTCGEGGALLINRPHFIHRAEIIREKGTNRSRFFRGEVDKYSWVDLGSSYLPSDILAAILKAQLDQWESIQARRRNLWQTYYKSLVEWAESRSVRMPVVPAHCEQAYHMFYLLMPDEPARARLIQHLKAKGILSVFHYLPLHLSDMGRRLGGQVGDCPVTEDCSDRLVRLPFYNDLTEQEVLEVCEAIRQL